VAAGTAAQLTALEERLHSSEHAGDPAYSADPGSLKVLRYGIEMNEWAAEWFERAARDLEREIAGDPQIRGARERDPINVVERGRR
jgi:hypothetical protein